MAIVLLVAGSTLTFWIPPVASTTSYSKVPGCSYNYRQLTYGSFQLTHMLRDDHAVELIRAMAAKMKTKHFYSAHNVATRVSAHKHQSTMAITMMWTEPSWAFPESYTDDDRALER